MIFRFTSRLGSSGHVPVMPNGAMLRILLAALFGAMTLYGAAVALTDPRPGYRLEMGAASIFAMSFGASFVWWAGVVDDRVVRVQSRVPELRFAAPASAYWPFLLSALAGVAVGVVALAVDLIPIAGQGDGFLARRLPYVIGLGGLVWLAQQLWLWRHPRGLTLDERGLRGMRGARGVDLAWDDLRDASVIASRGAKLALHLRSGSSVVLDPHWMGSDPNVVAAVIRWYLEHPEDRPLLAGGPTALGHVEETARRR